MFDVRFWGVRGSIPAPTTDKDVRTKIKACLEEYATNGHMDVEAFLKTHEYPFVHGGNTSCVEVVFDRSERFILDMGTGIRPLGNSLFPEMFQKRGLEITFLLSHVHWDHIQGLPFFGPLYINKEIGIRNKWIMYGGTGWQKDAEACLRGQMDPPTFPVSWEEISAMTDLIDSHSVHDRMSFTPTPGLKITCRKLNHPQETYGWRFETPDGLEKRIVAYTTDNEPYNPEIPHPPLLDLARDADIWITDCQYPEDVYNGKSGGVPRHGWGHSYPRAVAVTAAIAGVKTVVLFHHDPASSDDDIQALRKETERMLRDLGSNATVVAAWEGLALHT